MPWDNPLDAPEGHISVVTSFGLEPRDATKVVPNCFACKKELEVEGAMLSFGHEGPWWFCRDCVRQASKTFDFIASADW